tara:strand:+ start:132 stop:377 length:246 start_codon:yes stop_codon:yes gene_type:complete
MNQIDDIGVKSLVQFNLPISLDAKLLEDGSMTLSIGCPVLNIAPKLLIAARGNVRKFKTLDALYSTCKRIGVNEFPLTIKA